MGIVISENQFSNVGGDGHEIVFLDRGITSQFSRQIINFIMLALCTNFIDLLLNI